MKSHLFRIIDFFLYSNLWIAACAWFMCQQTYLLMLGKPFCSPLSGFVFCSTMVLYAIHRLVGIRKVAKFDDQGRYSIIRQFRSHILIYALMAVVAGGYFFLQLPGSVMAFLIVPGLIGFGYVFPLFSGDRRLRDFGGIKIFLVALVWPMVTISLPFIESGRLTHPQHYLMFVEKVAFIFAITIPFDIRDTTVDHHQNVYTIPGKLGVKTALSLAWIALGLSVSMVFLGYFLGFYTWRNLTALLISYVVTGVLLYLSKKLRSDYFYTGLLDGMMILQSALVML